jgi:hypothetical protein
MTAKEILEKLPEIFEGVSEFAYEEEWTDDENTGIGDFVEVEHYGGEGQGSTWYSIKHFKSHDIYIRVDGYYSSYNGTDFEEGWGEEVKPVTKTVTVFE